MCHITGNSVGVQAMENVWKDLSYGWRMLVKSPGFAVVAVLVLGLAIGANTSIFSLFNGVIWRPLPVKDPQQLLVIGAKRGSLGFTIPLSYPDFQDYRQLKAVFSDMCGYVPSPVKLQAEGRPSRAWPELVTGNYFSMLGLEAARARTFAADDGWAPAPHALIALSYNPSQTHCATNPLTL